MEKKNDFKLTLEGYDLKINSETMATQLGIYMQVKLLKAYNFFDRTVQRYSEESKEQSIPFLWPTVASQYFVGLCMQYIRLMYGRVIAEQLVDSGLWAPLSYMFECLFARLQQDRDFDTLDHSGVSAIEFSNDQ